MVFSPFMMTSSNKNHALDSHRFTLWNDATEGDNESFLIQTRTFSFGPHGAMTATLDSIRVEKSGLSDTGDVAENLIEHNVAELKRARSEGRKWDKRMKDSPLGKTQQDFAAYYTGVVAAFTDWCAAHGVVLPPR